MDEMVKKASPSALALASLCLMESLLLELTARKVLTRAEVIGLLKDAARALGTTPTDGRDDWLEGSAIIEAISERYERLPEST